MVRHSHSAKRSSSERLNYFYGQLLEHHDFRDEQAYFREKHELHNRCLHGWGVVCGLLVTPEPGSDDECAPECPTDPEELRERARSLRDDAQSLRDTAKRTQGDAYEQILGAAGALEEQAERLDELAAQAAETPQRKRSARVRIGPGLAIDPRGRELVLECPLIVDLWSALSKADRARLAADPCLPLYVSARYREVPTRRVRPAVADHCGPLGDAYSRVRETLSVEVTLEPPVDHRCDVCCEAPDLELVLLARIDHFDPRRGAGDIDNGARRMLSLHDPATIVAVSWVHGAEYPVAQLHELLGQADPRGGIGLRFDFSRPIRAATIAAPGVLEVRRYTGGGSPSGGIQWLPFEMDPVDEELVTSVVFRQSTDEHWSPWDRVHIVLRADFVLDACCRRLDGNGAAHIPLTEDGVEPAPAGQTSAGQIKAEAPHAPADEPCDHGPCARPPDRPGPWRSGNGTPGGTFESWFFVRPGRSVSSERGKAT